MKDYSVTRETTTVISRTMETPANWVDIMKMQSQVIEEWSRLHDRTGEPWDDAIWFEVGDDSVSICYKETTSAPATDDDDIDIPPSRFHAAITKAKAQAWHEGYNAGDRDASRAQSIKSGYQVEPGEDFTANPYADKP